MRLPIPPRYQYIGFGSSMPVIAAVFCYILFDDRVMTDWKVWAIAWPLIYVMGFFSWRMHYVYHHFVQMRYPKVTDTRQRVLAKLPIFVLVMTPSVLLILIVFHVLHILGYEMNWEDVKYALIQGLAVNITFETLWEVMYIIEKYKESAEEKEMIERLQLQQEFSNLKQKVNPHFLFNCFNTLSSLISEDKVQAGRFLDELSKVYRYLLRNNESGLSSIEQEMRFIQSYGKLLLTRYSEGFQMKVDIDPEFLRKEIPSLSLQLLVENAVKHNVISRQHAICVEITSHPDGYLVVENNLNKKTRFDSESTGIGLANIREKYRLLNHPDVIVEEASGRYRVMIPVLSS